MHTDNRDLEIENIRSQKYETLRATVSEVEELLYRPVKVLDHGFIRVIDYMGDDSAVVQAARVSYGKGTKKLTEDRGLIFYLMRHRHTTPFEMCEIKLHVKLPIFVARQWIRHRTASVNEYSARYSILSKEYYIPALDKLSPQSITNRQGRSDERALTMQESERVLDILRDDAENCYTHYQEMLNEDEHGQAIDENKTGLTRELARINLNLNYYTEWYWKINLHNLLRFLSLRADPHAQYEIRAYADAILDVVRQWVPHTYESFMEYQVNGASFSSKGLNVIRSMIKGNSLSQEQSGMSKREWNELMHILSETKQ